MIKDSTPDVKFPPGLANAFTFAGLNALSFQIILSSPVLLYAKSLGATATVLGIIAGMMPLLVIFQIPAASYIPRIGYKRFVYGGWGIRVLFIFMMALVPLTGSFLNPTTRLSLLLACLFGFNLSRGISSCAWLPWISSLVPAEIRGRFLVRDAAWVNLFSCLAFLFASFCLWNSPRPWQFSVLFLFSAIMGGLSLVFLKRIPDVEIPPAVKNSNEPVPWRSIAQFPPFRKLLWMNVSWAIASGGMTAFTVAYLRTMMDLSEGLILFLNSVTFLGGLACLWLVGARLDRLGSKPLLTLSCLLWLGIVVGWWLLASGIVKSLFLVLGLQFAMGLGAAQVNMANTRLAMAVVPQLGKHHFFALFSVIGNVAMGIAPIGWGIFIDAFRWLNVEWKGLTVNRYTLFFAMVFICFGITLVMIRRLEEREAKSLEDLLKDMLIHSPQRVFFRLWPR